MSTSVALGSNHEFLGIRLLKGGLVGGAAAAAGNLAVFFLAKAFGVSLVGLFDPSAPASTLPLGMVLVASLLPALAATGVLAAMNRFMGRPGRAFAILAGVFALLSMGGPFTLGGADGATKATLALMHVVAGAAITIGLLRFGRSEP